MDVTSLNRITQGPASGGASDFPREKVAENREVIQAVKALNSSENVRLGKTS